MSDAYRDTVFLPRTDFPMRAGLASQEPQWLERWQTLGLYAQLRAQGTSRPKFILHDGPPYANGDIHIGHALNKILKDMVVRSQQMRGFDAPFVPGWDCHGLPIEWKVEEEYRKKGKDKKTADLAEFRSACRTYAARWVEVQKAQFQRLGINADWANPYVTMDYSTEAAIVAELLKIHRNGLLYQGAKPVMWSPVEQTALAEAEVEYEDIISTQVDVAFEIIEAPNRPELVGAHAVIWTTTPWTLPVNRALAFGPEVEYRLYQTPDGRILLLADMLADSVSNRIGQPLTPQGDTFPGSALADATTRHPLHTHGDFFQTPRPLLPADFVTTEQGTGLVHMAPDHGEDDHALCLAHGIDPLFVVQNDGRYRDDWPLVGSNHVYKVNAPDGPICAALQEAGGLLAASADYAHSYPHSWRSKAKLIFRCTPQWFMAVDKPLPANTPTSYHPAAGQTVRQAALSAIAQTRWTPESGENRIRAMVEGRPDWVLSRQRAWGVPITLFVRKSDGKPLHDAAVDARIVEAVTTGGADAWWSTPSADLLGPDYDPQAYDKVTDILDVWFDSGCTHAYVVEARADLGQTLSQRASLYLEGSDQHRGWFQSSLLESVATRGRAPYDAVMTHGFTLDGQGRKMSKSLGNTVDPLKVTQQLGADILRLWVASVDASADQRISDQILAGQTEAYRKLRNTLRYLLGALDGFTDSERLAEADMPDLERWVLHRLSEMDASLRAAMDALDFTRYTSLLYQFCIVDLSAFYFDVRKDSLYCDTAEDPRRRACRTLLDHLFQHLVCWLAPVLVFTAEEAWQARFPSDTDSVHLQQWPTVPALWSNPTLAEKWDRIRTLRTVVTGALEVDRREKRLGAGLDGAVTLYLTDPADHALLANLDFAELALTAAVTVTMETPPAAAFHLEEVPGVAVVTAVSTSEKCGRCWRRPGDVGTQAAHPTLCQRCADVVTAHDA